MSNTDSKTLTHEIRSSLLGTLSSDPQNLGWSVRVVRYFFFYYFFRVCHADFFDHSPQAISSGMLRRPPTNLNRQSEEATIILIREVIQSGIQLSEVSWPFFVVV